MNKLIAFLVLGIAGISSLHADVTLFTLGSPAFDVQISQGSFNQDSTGLQWGGDMQGGDLVGGVIPSTLDLSTYTPPSWQLGVEMSFAGTNPNVSFTGEFFDSNFNSAIYSGSTPNIVNGVAVLDFESLSDPSFDSTNIVGFQLTWGGTGAEPATIVTAMSVMAVSTVAVPEPEVPGMLLIGLALCAVYRSRAKKIERTLAAK